MQISAAKCKMADKKEKQDNLKKLLSKYSINYEKLEKFFNISDMDSESSSLDAVREKIVEKLHFFSKMVEELLQPEASLQCIYECKVLNDKKRKDMFIIYKKMKRMERESNIIDLESNEKQNAEFIGNVLAEWEKIKDKLKPLLIEMKESWETDEILAPSDTRYMG